MGAAAAACVSGERESVGGEAGSGCRSAQQAWASTAAGASSSSCAAACHPPQPSFFTSSGSASTNAVSRSHSGVTCGGLNSGASSAHAEASTGWQGAIPAAASNRPRGKSTAAAAKQSRPLARLAPVGHAHEEGGGAAARDVVEGPRIQPLHLLHNTEGSSCNRHHMMGVASQQPIGRYGNLLDRHCAARQACCAEACEACQLSLTAGKR